MSKITIDRALLEQAIAQLSINRTNFLKGPSKSICKMLAGGNDEAITALREALAQQPPPPPPECKTEAERTAYAFGWFKALETVNQKKEVK